jgi:hypothetical protein
MEAGPFLFLCLHHHHFVLVELRHAAHSLFDQNDL